MLFWFVRSLLEILLAEKFDYRVANTTLAYYKRFYLRESVVRYPPNLLLFTCMIVAIKTENAVVENRPPSRLFGGTGKSLAYHEALALEPILCQSIKFDFYILHGDAPFVFCINSYYGYRKRRNDLSCPTNWTGGDSTASQNTEAKFVAWLEQLQRDCELLYLQLYVTDVHLLYRPSEVAIGVFAHVTKTRYRLTDVSEYISTVMVPPAIRGDPEKTAALASLISATEHEAFKADEMLANYVADKWRAAIPEILKESRKWSRTLGRLKRGRSET